MTDEKRVLPYGTRHSGRGPHDRRAMGEQILEARNRGRTMYEITRQLGISEATGYRYLDQALDARILPKVDEFRKQQNDSIDQTERMNEEQIELAEHIARKGALTENPNLILKAAAMRAEALRLRVKISERRAKLNGLDAPVVVQATVQHLGEMDAELAEIVREAEARAAQEEASRRGRTDA